MTSFVMHEEVILSPNFSAESGGRHEREGPNWGPRTGKILCKKNVKGLPRRWKPNLASDLGRRVRKFGPRTLSALLPVHAVHTS